MGHGHKYNIWHNLSLSLALWKLFGSTELHVYDLLFESDVGKCRKMTLFLSCAWTDVLATNLIDKNLAHSES